MNCHLEVACAQAMMEDQLHHQLPVQLQQVAAQLTQFADGKPSTMVHPYQKVRVVKPAPVINHTKSATFHTVLPIVNYEHAPAPRAYSILPHRENNCMHQF